MSIVRCTDLAVAHRDHVAVRGVDLDVAAGELVALVGGDGAGKTTVLRALAGRLSPHSGTITVRADGGTGVVPARGATWRDLTVDENLGFVRAAHGADPARLDDLVGRMGLRDARDRLAGHLSGGMRQKLALAMALVHGPSLLVLDEPTTGVDPVSRAEIWRLLGEELAAGAGIVLATTYLDEAERATRAVVLDRGDVLAAGPPARIVAETPGAVVAGAERLGPRSWRRGRTWHTWLDEPLPSSATDADGARRVTPDLEDAVIVRALAREVAA